MSKSDKNLSISMETIKIFLFSNYALNADTITHLYGEFDLNYKVSTQNQNFLLKISRDDKEVENISFQTELLNFLETKSKNIKIPKVIKSVCGNQIIEISDSEGNLRFVRLLEWMEGRLFSKTRNAPLISFPFVSFSFSSDQTIRALLLLK